MQAQQEQPYSFGGMTVQHAIDIAGGDPWQHRLQWYHAGPGLIRTSDTSVNFPYCPFCSGRGWVNVTSVTCPCCRGQGYFHDSAMLELAFPNIDEYYSYLDSFRVPDRPIRALPPPEVPSETPRPTGAKKRPAESQGPIFQHAISAISGSSSSVTPASSIIRRRVANALDSATASSPPSLGETLSFHPTPAETLSLQNSEPSSSSGHVRPPPGLELAIPAQQWLGGNPDQVPPPPEPYTALVVHTGPTPEEYRDSTNQRDWKFVPLMCAKPTCPYRAQMFARYTHTSGAVYDEWNSKTGGYCCYYCFTRTRGSRKSKRGHGQLCTAYQFTQWPDESSHWLESGARASPIEFQDPSTWHPACMADNAEPVVPEILTQWVTVPYQ